VLQDKVQQAAAYFCSRQTLLQPVLFDDRLYHKLLISSYFGLVGFEPTDLVKDRLISSQAPDMFAFLIPNPLHVFEQHFLSTPIIELGGATIGVTSDPLGHLQSAIVF
jgi:hypothetical protein